MGSFHILLVEDNAADQNITKEGLDDLGTASQLNVVSDGAEAMDFLTRKAAYTKMTRPDLVILDLNLPKVHGTEVLKKMRSDPDLKCTPVVILTSSKSQRDISEAYESGANAYAIKPTDVGEYFSLVKSIHDFWSRNIHTGHA